jgi:hypothetical protein
LANRPGGRISHLKDRFQLDRTGLTGLTGARNG